MQQQHFEIYDAFGYAYEINQDAMLIMLCQPPQEEKLTLLLAAYLKQQKTPLPEPATLANLVFTTVAYK